MRQTSSAWWRSWGSRISASVDSVLGAAACGAAGRRFAHHHPVAFEAGQRAHAGLAVGLGALAGVELQHPVGALGQQLAAARRHHAFQWRLAGQHKHVVAFHALLAGAVDKEHPAAVTRGLEHAGRHARQVAALLVAAAQLGAALVAPGPDEQQQRAHHHQHRPGHAQHRPHKAAQPQAAGKPDRHLAVAVHAAQRHHHRHEQAQGQHRRQVAQRGVAQQQHHVFGRHRATSGQPQGADQHHRDDDGEDDHQGGTEAAGQLSAQGCIE